MLKHEDIHTQLPDAQHHLGCILWR